MLAWPQPLVRAVMVSACASCLLLGSCAFSCAIVERLFGFFLLLWVLLVLGGLIASVGIGIKAAVKFLRPHPLGSLLPLALLLMAGTLAAEVPWSKMELRRRFDRQRPEMERAVSLYRAGQLPKREDVTPALRNLLPHQQVHQFRVTLPKELSAASVDGAATSATIDGETFLFFSGFHSLRGHELFLWRESDETLTDWPLCGRRIEQYGPHWFHLSC